MQRSGWLRWGRGGWPAAWHPGREVADPAVRRHEGPCRGPKREEDACVRSRGRGHTSVAEGELVPLALGTPLR